MAVETCESDIKKTLQVIKKKYFMTYPPEIISYGTRFAQLNMVKLIVTVFNGLS